VSEAIELGEVSCGSVRDTDPLAGVLSPGTPEQEMLRTCRLLMQPGEVHELRVPKAGRERTISGYFDDPEKMAGAALKLDGKYAGIYITLNPCKPELLARVCNRVVPYAELTTSDHDILCRHWLLIDCDPKRPSGISSTDAQHGRAITTACGIWDDLHGEGWPDPVVADSGNGAHLLYRISAPNSPEAAQLIQRTLKGIADRCAPDDVDVDLAVFNAARITKLYGTLTQKGDSIPGRPHRRARLLEIPQPLREMELTI
jgi:hypothetical protein